MPTLKELREQKSNYTIRDDAFADERGIKEKEAPLASQARAAEALQETKGSVKDRLRKAGVEVVSPVGRESTSPVTIATEHSSKKVPLGKMTKAVADKFLADRAAARMGEVKAEISAAKRMREVLVSKDTAHSSSTPSVGKSRGKVKSI